MDLSLAFDIVQHLILLQKLEKYVLRDHANDLLKSYLINSLQLVEVDEVITHISKWTISVSQDYVKGPLLCITVVNSFPRITKT